MRTHTIASLLVILFSIATSRWSAAEALSLDGTWSFQFDSKDAGVSEQWFAKPLTGSIRLPNTTSTAGLGEETSDTAHGMLTLLRPYVGPAWYQRDVEIPAAWSGKPVMLHLERVLWRSTVWVDGKSAGNPLDFLSVPHDHELGVLAPGRHMITVRVDNREIHPIGLQGHHYYPGMQTLWNGIIGKIELRPRPALSRVRLFPSFKDQTVGVEVSAAAPGNMTVTIREKASGEQVAQGTFPASGRHELKLNRPPLPWDEFTPNLYAAEITLGADCYRSDLGFRDLGKDEYHLTINGRPMFFRNNHDGCIFPLTGHPPTDVASWKRILKIYKDHGLNGIRFHSWTPPEAAFTAADELGIYIQSELFWCRLDASADLIAFAKAEMRAALDRYGNHPSMCYVLYGNELSGDLRKIGSDWLKADRSYDPRHLYSVAAGRRVAGADDFSEYGAKMNWQAPHTDWDYSGYFAQNHLPGLPEITHELGQPATHPDWREITKYTGVLKPRNLEAFRKLARQAGVETQSADFQRASGNINRINYKSDIEALLRTPQSAGYNLLDMHDYSGQGEALVGWLDAFHDEKGFLTSDEFRHYGGATVPLARLPRFVFTSGETLTCKAELAHYGAAPLVGVALEWTLCNEAGLTIASGILPARDVPVGGVTRFGGFSHTLTTKSQRGERLRLKFVVAGFSNTWDLWLFPAPSDLPLPAEVLITSSAADATAKLRTGGKVLLVANRLGRKTNSAFASFKPPFWSASYFGNGGSVVQGAVIQNQHPALASFPTGDVMDRQWQALCSDAHDFVATPAASWRDSSGGNNAHGFDLSGFPADYRPIVQPVCDFHNPRKVGTVFEVATRTGGKLLVSGYDVLADHPAARQLKRSLLAYIGSSKFNPSHPVEESWILKMFEDPEAPVEMPPGFGNAILYVKAGGRHPTGNGNVNWTGAEDATLPPKAPAYKVQGATVWADELGTTWAGTRIQIEIPIQAAMSGVLKVRFVDWNHAGRRGTIRSEDDQKQELGSHENGQWIEFAIRREDCLDGKIVLDAETTAGPNLMVSEMVLLPQ